jgi:hypothetical protein
MSVKKALRQLAGAVRFAPLLALVQLHHKSALRDLGWFRSYSERRPVDSQGLPIPFMSYGAITFLSNKACGECSVFEFGSGYSTLWWASRVQRVVSCEHDQSWYEQLTKLIPSNVTLLYRELDNSRSYVNAIVDHEGTFDIIVIDGRERLACVNASLPFLSSRGVIVWDDTDRERYKAGILSLRQYGFRQIEFVGIGPMLASTKYTSIFYRADNVLGM